MVQEPSCSALAELAVLGEERLPVHTGGLGNNEGTCVVVEGAILFSLMIALMQQGGGASGYHTSEYFPDAVRLGGLE